MFKDTPAFSGFSVNNLDEAKKFYEQTLGLAVKELPSMGYMLKLAGGQEAFMYQKDNHQPATYTMLNFKVTDIDKAVDELKSAGVSLEHYDNMPQDEKGIMRGLSAPNQGPDIAWFKDPAGNVIAILQES